LEPTQYLYPHPSRDTCGLHKLYAYRDIALVELIEAAVFQFSRACALQLIEPIVPVVPPNRIPMNLYLRLLWAAIRSWRLRRIEPGEWIERRMRVLPGDLDVNGHMNNGRYLTILDLLLVEYAGRTGLARAMFSAGWRPMAGGAFITYRKGLRSWQRYRLRYALTGADEIWNYMRFEFLRDDGALCATGYVKGAAVGPSGFVTTAEAFARMGQKLPQAPLPEPVRHWLAAEASAMSEARQP
jgi:acyl-CoA thioesterase FadM